MCVNTVTVEQITKIYKLYERPLDRLKELLIHRPFHKELVAIHDVSFSLKKGDTLGVIGDNGAGKSTLLKILSKTLSPTRGRFEVQGLVTSLLELGSGFHPEFSGMENIFFYGSLLGIDNVLMKKKVNEIVEFAELGDFIHYPIKTYSTGMHLRLAFSVATAVDPDILIIDEALSVGDQYFQKKCLDKMHTFKKRKKTIIFCSHDTYQVRMFCQNTLWLEHGKIKMLGTSDDVVNRYINYGQEKTMKFREEVALLQTENTLKDSFLHIGNLSVKQENPDNIVIEFTVSSAQPYAGHPGWAILRRDMLQIAFMTTHMQAKEPIIFDGLQKVHITIDRLNIVNDTYFIYVGILDKQAYKPIAVESIECTLYTGLQSHNSLCHFDSTFFIE